MNVARVVMRLTMIGLVGLTFCGGVWVATGTSRDAGANGVAWGGAIIVSGTLGLMILAKIIIPNVRYQVFRRKRNRLDDLQLAQEFDPNACYSAKLIVELVKELEHLYSLPAGTLRSSDRFADELCMLGAGWFFDYAEADRFYWAERRLGTDTHALAECQAAGDFVREIAKIIGIRIPE